MKVCRLAHRAVFNKEIVVINGLSAFFILMTWVSMEQIDSKKFTFEDTLRIRQNIFFSKAMVRIWRFYTI
ncbi:hypothetical protein DHW03_15140 [Pedobacter yonginense]|uniref:Uncharacterized protein n=1 Tax=Pedobacter yonginense TaxID=651869 RepID=A0A317EH41_9SPHI|nr:hypothetical protein DHW03_15140 [Pedobacter yonginense]